MSFCGKILGKIWAILTLRSDNIGMGHDGMSYSLPSRDLIAGKFSQSLVES